MIDAARDAQQSRDECADLREDLRRAEAEIERLEDAKCRATVIADERAKENAELRQEIERLWAMLEGRAVSRCNKWLI